MADIGPYKAPAEWGDDWARSVTMTVDVSATERRAFGLFRWRLRLAVALFRLGCSALRCNIEVRL
jgi:hypothetical protein